MRTWFWLCTFLGLHLSSPLLAQTFIFIPDRAELSVKVWNYREVSSRTWLPGCLLPDVLQGTGWFPNTFYTDYTPQITVEGYQIQLKQGGLARYCAAKMDAFNSVRLQLTSDDAPEGVWEGSLSVIPDESAQQDASISCRVDGVDGPFNAIRCESPRIKLSKNSVHRIIMQIVP